MIKIDNTEQFESIIGEGVTLVDFYADWCGPCKMLAPVLEELSEEREDVTFIKVNIEEFPQLTSDLGVMSVPTLIVFKDGQPVGRTNGFRPKDAVIDLIEPAL